MSLELLLDSYQVTPTNPNSPTPFSSSPVTELPSSSSQIAPFFSPLPPLVIPPPLIVASSSRFASRDLSLLILASFFSHYCLLWSHRLLCSLLCHRSLHRHLDPALPKNNDLSFGTFTVTDGFLEESREALAIAETDGCFSLWKLFSEEVVQIEVYITIISVLVQEFEESEDPENHFQALVSLAKEGIQKGNRRNYQEKYFKKYEEVLKENKAEVV
ncbi:hypothetical protein Ahy_A10g048485 [Arachis hypogaea]|uniref:Uncharacterized protein n=1 Tax=Arachis hypogaea TaxID=3818 RepID=A0A445B593_ARAHY|nr:hypothetical protein Ahy_A10g048485 [Arachis hypogaea]